LIDERLNDDLVSLEWPTVRDYVRYVESYPELLGPHGDVKDVQRPWALEQIRRLVPVGAKVIDMGGASCELASQLMDDYEVTVVDPYDGTGNGPKSFSPYKARFPRLSFVAAALDETIELPRVFDAVVSTSVLEHIPSELIGTTLRGIDRVLKPGGFSIHAIDFTVRGEGGGIKERTDAVLSAVFRYYGLPLSPEGLAEELLSEVDTYYLSPQMYLRWKKARKFEEYPWRQVSSLNLTLRR